MRRPVSIAIALTAVRALMGAVAWSLRVSAEHEAATRALSEALYSGDVVRIREMIDRGADPNAREYPAPEPPPSGLLARIRILFAPPRASGTGATALIVAAHAGDAALVHDLLERGADVNTRDDAGVTPLIAATGGGNFGVRNPDAAKVYTVARELIERGADINAMDGDGETPLSLVAWLRDDHCDRLLLEHNADVTKRLRLGETALFDAVDADRLDLAREELARGAPATDSESNHGVTALMIAADNGDIEMVRLLLHYGANPNAVDDGQTYGTALAATIMSDRPHAKANRNELVGLLRRNGATLPRARTITRLGVFLKYGDTDLAAQQRSQFARDVGRPR